VARKRRSTEIFSMSFLDCMSCGFGAVILFFMIINSNSDVTNNDQTKALQAETDKLEIEVLEGRKNLALARTSIQKLETEEEEASDQISIILALIAELQAELAKSHRKTPVGYQVARGRSQTASGIKERRGGDRSASAFLQGRR